MTWGVAWVAAAAAAAAAAASCIAHSGCNPPAGIWALG